MILKKIKYLIGKIFQPKVQAQADKAFKIYEALKFGDYSVLNAYCRSKSCIDIICMRMEIYTFKPEYIYASYSEYNNFDVLESLTYLINNKSNIDIAEFFALYFFLKCALLGNWSFEINFTSRELDIYTKFLEQI